MFCLDPVSTHGPFRVEFGVGFFLMDPFEVFPESGLGFFLLNARNRMIQELLGLHYCANT